MSRHHREQVQIRDQIVEQLRDLWSQAKHFHLPHDEVLRRRAKILDGPYRKLTLYNRGYINGIDDLSYRHHQALIGYQLRLDNRWKFNFNIPDGRHREAHEETVTWRDARGEPSSVPGRLAYLNAPDKEW